MHLLTLDQFVTSTRIGPSGAASGKRKAPDNSWLEHYDFVVLLARQGLLHQGAVAPRCSEVSQLGPGNAYLKSHF